MVSFLRSTERYGTRLAQLLPDLLSLPGWTLSAKVLYRDSTGRRRHLDFRLDQGMAEYLAVPSEEADRPEFPPVLEAVAASAERAGLRVDRGPPPLAVGGGLEYPDLVLSREGKSLYVEAVGYWSSEWLERKLQRTERAPGPYAVVAPRDLAVAAAFDHPRLFVAGRGGLRLEHLKSLLPVPELPREPPRREVAPGEMSIPAGPVLAMGEVARENRLPSAQAKELLESLGFVCAGGFAVRREALPEIHEEIRKSLPELESVERALRRWDLTASVLPALGFSIKWNGLSGAVVRER